MKTFGCIALLLFLAMVLVGAPKYEPTAENLESRRWFQEARFGLFNPFAITASSGK